MTVVNVPVPVDQAELEVAGGAVPALLPLAAGVAAGSWANLLPGYKRGVKVMRQGWPRNRAGSALLIVTA